MQLVDIKKTKKCAFCTHWYDPSNQAIRPKVPKINLWEFDGLADNMCQKKNHNTKAQFFCNQYQCKIDVN